MTAIIQEWHLPPAALTLPRQTVHVWYVSLEQPAPLTHQLEQLLSSDERERAARFHFEHDRRRFIVGHGALRTLLGRYLQVEPTRLEFCYGAYGKPYLAEESTGGALRFNLAHSHELAVYAFTREGEVGIDIEHIHPLADLDHIAARFFSKAESTILLGLPEDQRLMAFFNCWTRKEAYIKARGEGLSHPLDQFQVSLIPGEPTQLLKVEGSPEEVSRWFMTAFVPSSWLCSHLNG
ncbi:4'-phosphopantetheinyl transferase [Thermoflexales bacterium]|nr:4'-phosphopantetheinyl transferase [Thermoflexales bacterium]